MKGFKPIVCKEAEILILGSMPSVVSLEKSEYYGFKHNRFWKIISEVYKETFITYEDKKKCLYKHKIALWDVIESCEREGSLDSNIRNVVCNDLEGFVKKYPNLKLIICNGKKSGTLYEKHFSHKISVPYHILPSTSNANRTIKEIDLFKLWKETLLKR